MAGDLDLIRNTPAQREVPRPTQITGLTDIFLSYPAVGEAGDVTMSYNQRPRTPRLAGHCGHTKPIDGLSHQRIMVSIAMIFH